MTALPDRTVARLLAQAAPRLGQRGPPLSALAVAVLLFLEEGPGSVQQMSDAWGISKHTITPHVLRVVNRGLVERRARALTLTAKGHRLLRTAYRHRRDA